MSDKPIYYNNGIGLGPLLFIVFLILKLTGTIAWSWWWVLSPIWIPAVIVLVILLVVLAIFLLKNNTNK